jgi:hypothetical protein
MPLQALYCTPLSAVKPPAKTLGQRISLKLSEIYALKPGTNAIGLKVAGSLCIFLSALASANYRTLWLKFKLIHYQKILP